MLLIMFDPLAQIDKAKNAQRKQDFVQIRNALDTFYNDHGRYPLPSDFSSGSFPFGSSWTDSVNGTVYMKKVPQDPDCYTTGYCYVYKTNTNTTTPQWNILFARTSMPDSVRNKLTWDDIAKTCPAMRTVCPGFFDKRYDYCVLSGTIECSSIGVLPDPAVPNLPSQPPTQPPAQPGVDCSATGYFAVSAGLCNGLGADLSKKCLIHRQDGTGLTCYSAGGGSSCGGTICNH